MAIHQHMSNSIVSYRCNNLQGQGIPCQKQDS